MMQESEIKALVSLLDDEDVEIVDHVEGKIVSLGDVVIPFLEKEWETNFNPIVQKRIEDLIHSVQYVALREKLVEWKKNESDDLLKGMYLIATYQYPDLELEELNAKIEQIYYEVWLVLNYDLQPIEQVRLINDILFGKLKYGANTKNFHGPNNSMLNAVIDSKKGNPISLCVIYMLVARKLKLPIFGVNLPNLFILTYKTDETQFYINAFNKGLIFSKEDIDNYIGHLNLEPNPIFYEPTDNVSILKRVLRNLIVAFEKIGDNERKEEMMQLLNDFNDDGGIDIT